MGFFSFIADKIRSFEDAFCNLCDYIRYDDGLVATITRKAYQAATFIPNLGAEVAKEIVSFGVNCVGELACGSVSRWEKRKADFKDKCLDIVCDVNKQLQDWGVNTRFAGEVINVAFIVTPSLKNAGKSAHQLFYHGSRRSNAFNKVKQKQKEFERENNKQLKKDKLNGTKRMFNTIFAPISEAEKQKIWKSIDLYQKLLEDTARRAKTEK